MATITTSFLKQGTCGTTGNIRTCFRYNNAGASSTCDIGGSGSGTNYRNVVAARFDTLPAAVSSAKLTVTYQQSGSDYWNAAQTVAVYGCANFSNSSTGTNLPARYGTAVQGSLSGGTASITINVTTQMQTALANGSKCLYIYANAADNRKRVNAITLDYEPIRVSTSGGDASNVQFTGVDTAGTTHSKLTVTGLKINNTTVF